MDELFDDKENQRLLSVMAEMSIEKVIFVMTDMGLEDYLHATAPLATYRRRILQ